MSRLNHVSALMPGFDGYLRRPAVHNVMNMVEAEAASPTGADDWGGEVDGTQTGVDADPIIEADWKLLVTDRRRFLQVANTVLAVSHNGDYAIELNDESFYDEENDFPNEQIELADLGMHMVPEREIARSMGHMSST